MQPFTGLGGLPRLRDYTASGRAVGIAPAATRTFSMIEPGETANDRRAAGPGLHRHIWMTLWLPQGRLPPPVVIRIFWDGQSRAQRRMPAGRLLRPGSRQTQELRYGGDADESAGRPGHELLVADAVQEVRPIRDRPTTATEFPQYFYIDYETYDSPSRPGRHGLFPRAVAARKSHRQLGRRVRRPAQRAISKSGRRSCTGAATRGA
jgi:hypothetical protein